MKKIFLKSEHLIRRWLTSRNLPIFLAVIVIILSSLSLKSGLQFDDYIHRMILLGESSMPVKDASVSGLFSFVNGDQKRNMKLVELGAFPWWTYQEIRASFWRPLSEITHVLDYKLWPNSPWLMHLQNLLWLGAIIIIITRLYRRIIGAGCAAGLAALLYAIDDAHGLPISWIANRNALVCTFFGGLTLLMHDRWRRNGCRHGSIWGPVCYSAALLGGEAGLGTIAYLFAYMLYIEKGTNRKRIRGFLPYAVITILWGTLYRILGFGVYGMGAYIDPGTEPFAFIRAVIERAPVLILGLFGEPPADFYGADLYRGIPHGNFIVWLVAIGFIAAMIFVLSPIFKRDNVVRFWTVGMLLSLIPVSATFPNNRLFLIPGIGAMGIIARFLANRSEQKPPLSENRSEHPSPLSANRFRRICTKSLVIMFIVVHIIIAPLNLPLTTITSKLFYTFLVSKPALSMPFDKDISDKTVVLMNPPSAFWGMQYDLYRRAQGLPVPARMYSLASGSLPLKITRTENSVFEIECGKGLLQMTFDQVLRGPSNPMHVGDKIELYGITVEVLALADSWQPSRARFTFSKPLDDSSIIFLQWKDKGFVRYTPPDTGKSETFPVFKLF